MTQKIIDSLLLSLTSHLGHQNTSSAKNLRKVVTNKPGHLPKTYRQREARDTSSSVAAFSFCRVCPSRAVGACLAMRERRQQSLVEVCAKILLFRRPPQMSFTTVMHAFPQNDVPFLFANFTNTCQLSGTSHESRILCFCH